MYDKENELALLQTMVQAVGTAYFANSIPLGTPGTPTLASVALGHRAGGGARQLCLVILITTTYAAAAGASTVTFFAAVGTGVTAGGVLNAGQRQLCATEAIAKASLVAGYRRILPIPDSWGQETYLSGGFTVATNDGTAGAFTAYLAPIDAIQQAVPPVPSAQ